MKHDLTTRKYERRARKLYALFSCLVLALTVMVVPAFAADDPLTVVNNLSEFIFSLIRAIGLILLIWIWNLVKNFGLGLGTEAEDPVKLSIRSVLFILLAYYANEIVDLVLGIGGTPYDWIMNSALPSLDFASFNSVMLTIIGVCASGAVTIIVLILVLILAWNYLKLLFEAAERYVLLGILVYTAPVAFAMGSSQATSNIFRSWCRMFGGQIFLLLMNAWCLRLFVSMV